MERKKFEQAKEQGRQARRAGRKRSENPYKLGTSTEQHNGWLLGFDEAASQMKVRR